MGPEALHAVKDVTPTVSVTKAIYWTAQTRDVLHPKNAKHFSMEQKILKATLWLSGSNFEVNNKIENRLWSRRSSNELAIIANN